MIDCEWCKGNRIFVPPWKRGRDVEEYLTKCGWVDGICPECAEREKQRKKGEEADGKGDTDS